MSYYSLSLNKLKSISKKKENRLIRKTKVSLFGNDDGNLKIIKNEFDEKIKRVDGNIPVDIDIKQGDRFLFISYDQSRYTHGLHKYPAKFFPELPRWLIQRYSKPNDIILDPFSGSGTSNIEANIFGRHSVGIDVDPFANFLSKVKTTSIKEEILKDINEYLLRNLVQFKPSKISNYDIPEFPYRDNWFNKEIILELAYIKKLIQNLEIEQKIKNFYLICFSSIIRNVSNADNNCTRTVIRKKLKKNIYPSMALTNFAESIFLNTYRMMEFNEVYNENFLVDLPSNQDAKDMEFEQNYFDFIITSPPYVNAVDYPRTHQLEIYWLGIENGSLTPLKKRHIGTESVEAKYYKEVHLMNIPSIDDVLKKIFEVDNRRAYIVYKYCNDMKTHLSRAYNILKKGGKYAMVVGNNKIRGFTFENWKYIIEIATDLGFRVDNYFGSEIIKHFIKVPRDERINTDWVIILEK